MSRLKFVLDCMAIGMKQEEINQMLQNQSENRNEDSVMTSECKDVTTNKTSQIHEMIRKNVIVWREEK